MENVARTHRRAFLATSVLILATGCQQLPRFPTKTPPPSGPQQAIKDYFSYLSQERYADATNLMTDAFKSRLGPNQVATMLHSIASAQVTTMVDAVTWADGLGAHLPSPPADRREYLVTLTVEPSDVGKTDWSAGMNRRFVDVLQQGGYWRIDALDISPGVLITGQPAKAAPRMPTSIVIATQPLRLGSVPIDRIIYGARQRAADRGQLPWAIDPIQVVHRDGPSFGINSGDKATLLRQDVDPVTLIPRATVLVHHGDRLLVVTLEQPIKAGPGGIWAIARLRDAPL